MHLPDSVERNPDAVSHASVERQLGVGRDGAGEEPDFSGKTAQVIDSQVSVSPDERLSALEIHESRAERIAISEFLLYLCKGLDRRVHVVIDAAVAAAQVASVRDEDDTLQRDIDDYLNLASSYVKKANCLKIEDRISAIEEAVELMNRNDNLFILGKGSEKFLYKSLIKQNYEGDKDIAIRYMNKRLREEKEVEN